MTFPRTTTTAASEGIASAINAISDGHKLRIVEAGCGRSWSIKLDNTPYELIGVDTDEAALQARKKEFADLDQVIYGDVQDASILPSGEADAVYSSFVAEHLPEAERALEGHLSWLRSGGLLIIRVPDARSVYGFISQRTPHRFHVWVYRRIFNRPFAGKPGHNPYPVHYSRLLTRRGLSAFAEEHRLDVVTSYRYEQIPSRPRWRRYAMQFVMRVVSVLSLGYLSGSHNNLSVVLRKP